MLERFRMMYQRTQALRRRFLIWSCCTVCLVSLSTAATIRAEDVIGYDQVKDILRKRCSTCHNPEEMRGDLDLKDLTAIKAGSSSGPVVVANDPSTSLLYTTVAHLEDPVMPPNSPRIPAREQDIIRRWIEGGLAVKSGAKSNSASVENLGGANEISEVHASNMAANSSKTIAGESPAAPRGPGLVAVRSLMQPSAANVLASHPQRDLVAVNGLRQAVLIDPTTAKILGAVDVPGNASALRFSKDGKLLLVGVSEAAVSGTVIAFDVDDWKIAWQVGDETDTILAMDLSADGTMLAVGGPSKTVRLYDTKSGAVLHSLKKHTDWILTTRFSPDGLLLASGDRFGGIVVWDPQSGKVFHQLKDHVGPVHSLDWDVSSDTLLSGGDDGVARTWNLHHGELTSRWDAGVGAILAVVRGKDFVATTGRKNTLALWRSPEALLGTVVLEDQGESLAQSADGKQLIVGSADGQISIIQTEDLSIANGLTLPIDTGLVEKLTEQVDAQYARYLVDTERKAIERSTEIAVLDKQLQPNVRSHSPTDSTSSNSASIATPSSAKPASFPSKSMPNASITLTNSSLLVEQLNYNKAHLLQLQTSLQTSNQSLSDLANLNQDLIRMVGQSSQIQVQLAKQIAEQAKQLELLQAHNRQLEELLSQSP